jgi:flavin-binding protein dodecin
MAESVYKVIELIGTSSQSWERAAAAAVQRASKTLRDLRIAEISELDMVLENGKIQSYRAKVRVSFKYEDVGKAPAKAAMPAPKAAPKKGRKR